MRGTEAALPHALHRVVSGLLPLLMLAAPVKGQEAVEGKAEVAGATLHYVDFGGDGLPIVFIHAADRGAHTWSDFAPSFTEEHRVLALTARGVGGSTGEPAPVNIRAEDIVGFLDAMGLEHAVFIGNSSPAQDMTDLAEHHPERVKGLVYLANAPPGSGLGESDPTGAFRHALEATGNTSGFPYEPSYLDDPEVHFTIPALTFVGVSGTRGLESRNFPLQVAEAVAAGGSEWIDDPEAKAYLERLARDEEMQRQVEISWNEHVVPFIHRNERAFIRSFGDNIEVVQLPIPLVTGYEYRDRPELIVDHIRGFLRSLTGRTPEIGRPSGGGAADNKRLAPARPAAAPENPPRPCGFW